MQELVRLFVYLAVVRQEFAEEVSIQEGPVDRLVTVSCSNNFNFYSSFLDCSEQRVLDFFHILYIRLYNFDVVNGFVNYFEQFGSYLSLVWGHLIQELELAAFTLVQY